MAPPIDKTQSRSEWAFYVVLAMVFLITVTSLGLALSRSTVHQEWVNQEMARIESTTPKGDVSQAEREKYLEARNLFKEETNRLQNIITILLGVFQAGTGAILGLLTGKATSK
jgi:hypothetical protein